MNVYTYILCFLLISVSEYMCVPVRDLYENPSYNSDRDAESVPVLSAHPKKRYLNEDAQPMREDEEQAEEVDHAGSGYENTRYRKFQPADANYMHRAARDEARENQDDARFQDEKAIDMQKREYYNGPNNAKDSSIQVILDPRAKKAVAVVENSPTGQATYDLSGWKAAKEDDDNQYPNQEQVVSLVYPADRTERKLSSEALDSISDYSNSKLLKSDYKEKNSDTALEETHKRKRNAELSKRTKFVKEKRSIIAEISSKENKRKADSENQEKAEPTKSNNNNDCPPHNSQSSINTNSDANQEKLTNEKESLTSKREVSKWSQEQINALTSSLTKARENSAEMDNVKNILYDMGLVDDVQMAKKRESNAENNKENAENLTPAGENAAAEPENLTENAKRDLQQDDEDEDMSKDNIILERNDRQIADDAKWKADVNEAPQEPTNKRETETDTTDEENSEEAIDETASEQKSNNVMQSDAMEAKRSSVKDENAEDENSAKEEEDANEETPARKKRQDAENKMVENEKAPIIADNNESILTENKMENSKFVKRETESSAGLKEKRKNHEDTEAEYEKKMESQIQAKIDAIKEKIKREILEEQDERYKRSIKENDLASSFSNSEALKPHIRKRREVAKDEVKIVKKETENSAANKEKSLDATESEAKIVRRKRANGLPEKQMVYRPYQTEQDDDGDEDGEFDDNSYDGRMYVEKRQAADDEDFQYYDAAKRDLEEPEKSPTYLQHYPEFRNRRSFSDEYNEDSSAFHGGGMLASRKGALRNKNFDDREKREEGNTKSNEVAENSDNEYFGPLPQYNGDLTRYKRVKRDNPTCNKPKILR